MDEAGEWAEENFGDADDILESIVERHENGEVSHRNWDSKTRRVSDD